MGRAALGQSLPAASVLLEAPQVAAGERGKLDRPHYVVLQPSTVRGLSYTLCSVYLVQNGTY